MRHGAKARSFLLLLSIFMLYQGALAANPVGKAATATAGSSQYDIDMRNAWSLYGQQKFAASADAFEAIIRTAAPNARLYYFGALANRGCNRNVRAKQLCQFVTAHFPSTQESAYAQKLFPTSIAQLNPELPESVRNALPESMQSMMDTAEGRQAIREAMAKDPKSFETVKKAERQGLLTKTTIASAHNGLSPKAAFGAKTRTGRPFTAADIARDGAGGIDQSRFPNCWFECSMSALAELPRGQELMANMIRYGEPGSYVVRFPGDGKEYVVSETFMEGNGIHDKALWASIIECAQVQKFPNNQGAEGAESNQSRLEVGLGCITGCKAEALTPSTCSAQELSTFIGGAVSSKNPIVCGTFPAGYLSALPYIVVPQHAYTVIGFDPSKNMVMIRNPHGANAQKFHLSSDPTHQDFEQLNDGIFKMSIPLFQKYFSQITRSFI